MKNKKLATIIIVLILIVIIAVACIVLKNSKNDESYDSINAYSKFSVMPKPTINRDEVIYHIDYLDYNTLMDDYKLEVDKNGNYDLTYVKYDREEANIGQNYYFCGTFSEKDFESFKQIIAQLNTYLEGIKKDFEKYEFYYNYKDVNEQNENGNKILKVLLTEIINHTVYNNNGARISNFDEILSILNKYAQNPNLDLDAELVLNEKGVIQEETNSKAASGEEVDEVNQNENNESIEVVGSSLYNIPVATGEKQDVARLDRIVITLKEELNEEESTRVLADAGLGILFRFENQNKYIILIDECENENKVLEKCQNIKDSSESILNAELCYE